MLLHILCCTVVPSSLLRLPHTAVSTLAVLSLHFTYISLQTLHCCAFFKDRMLNLFWNNYSVPPYKFTLLCVNISYICCCPKTSSCCLFLFALMCKNTFLRTTLLLLLAIMLLHFFYVLLSIPITIDSVIHGFYWLLRCLCNLHCGCLLFHHTVVCPYTNSLLSITFT